MASNLAGQIFGTLAKKLQISASVPALFFWCGVFSIWFLTHDCDFLPTPTSELVIIIRGVLLVVLFCFLVIVSSNLVEWAIFPAFGLLEGYWKPEWDVLPLIGPCIKKHEKEAKQLKKDLKKKRKILKELDKKEIEEGHLSPEDQDKYTTILLEITNYPEDENYVRPTLLGNIISAAEEYPYRRYGLEFNVVFPRLFLVLPEPFQKKVEESVKVLDERISLVIWGLLFLTCSILPFIRCYDNWDDFVASIRCSLIIIFIGIIAIIFGTAINFIFEEYINSREKKDINSEEKELKQRRLRLKWRSWGTLFSFCISLVPFIRFFSFSNLFPFIRFDGAEWDEHHLIAIVVASATILGSIIVIASARQVATSAALDYANMLRSAFDLYRFNLYDELKWPLPIFPKTERDEGIKLTQYLIYHDVSPGNKFKMTDFEQSVPINIVQFELQDFRYLIEAGNKAFELPINLAIENVDYHKIFAVISQVKRAFEKLKENERFFEILLQYPRHLENTRELFDHFIAREKELMIDAGFHCDWRNDLSKKLNDLIGDLRELLNISDKVFPFLSWTDFQDIKSRKREIEVIKNNLRRLESELEDKLRERPLEPQKIQETLDSSCLFLGGAALVFINCSTMISRSGLSSQFSELSILLGSILLVKTQ